MTDAQVANAPRTVPEIAPLSRTSNRNVEKKGRAIEISNLLGIYDRPSLASFIIPFDVSAMARLEERDCNYPFT
jgi:hypothetical protein